MTIKTVRAFKASDGQLFEFEQQAMDHEFEIAMAEWWKSLEFTRSEDVLLAIIADRMKLLPIFKMLNGGSTIVLKPIPPQPVLGETGQNSAISKASYDGE